MSLIQGLIGVPLGERLYQPLLQVGSTLGITPSLSNIGKTIIIFMMFAGRVGPLTIAYALARQQHKNKGIIKYPEEKILVG